MKKCRCASGWSLRNSGKSVRRAASCGIYRKLACLSPLARSAVLLLTRSSGNLRALLPSLIFFTIQPMRGHMYMGVRHVTLHNAPQHILAEGGFSSPLTSGTFACTIDTQRTFRWKNLERIRRNYVRIVCAIERSDLEWHAKGRRYCKGCSHPGTRKTPTPLNTRTRATTPTISAMKPPFLLL